MCNRSDAHTKFCRKEKMNSRSVEVNKRSERVNEKPPRKKVFEAENRAKNNRDKQHSHVRRTYSTFSL